MSSAGASERLETFVPQVQKVDIKGTKATSERNVSLNRIDFPLRAVQLISENDH